MPRVSDLQLLENRLNKSVQETIVTTVNGKIDRLSATLNDHISKHEAFDAEIRPILEAYNGGKALGNFAKWLRDVGVAIAATVLAIKALF